MVTCVVFPLMKNRKLILKVNYLLKKFKQNIYEEILFFIHYAFF